MVKLKSRQSDLEVYFEAEMIDEIVSKAGYTETSSIYETNKTYYTKVKILPSDITVKYMTREQYLNLVELFTVDGNLFDLETDEGDSFLKCYHKDDLKLTKNRNRQNNSYFYTGTLSLGVR